MVDNDRSLQTQNWGWAQFSRRDNLYYHNILTKQQNAFLVICTITSPPCSPKPIPTIPQSLVPRVLLDAMGGLLNEYVMCVRISPGLMIIPSPVYSDVEFVLPRRGKPLHAARRIYASRRLLQRVEYFETSEIPLTDQAYVQ